MNFRYGNMWDHEHEYDYVVVTGNGYVRTNGTLTMGAGAAKALCRRRPGIDKKFGAHILRKPGVVPGSIVDYSIILDKSGYGVLQVKDHWKASATLRRVNKSLIAFGVTAKAMGNKRFALNYPGIGLGELPESAVAPLVMSLPDNVDVWKFDKSDYLKKQEAREEWEKRIETLLEEAHANTSSTINELKKIFSQIRGLATN